MNEYKSPFYKEHRSDIKKVLEKYSDKISKIKTDVPENRSDGSSSFDSVLTYIIQKRKGIAPRSRLFVRLKKLFNKRSVKLSLVGLVFAGLFVYFVPFHSSQPYRKIHKIEGSHISALRWHNNELWVSDWMEQCIFRYSLKNGALALKRKYNLKDVHITSFAIAGDKIYIFDSWEENIQERAIDEKLRILNKIPFSGKVTSISFDGQNFWSCNVDGNISSYKADDKFTVMVNYKPDNHPDQIFKEKADLWSASSSKMKIYKHNIDANLSVREVYKINSTFADKPLLAFTWHKEKLWFIQEDSSELVEINSHYLEKISSG